LHEPNRAPSPVKTGFAFAGASPLADMPSFSGAIVPLPQIAHGAAGAGFVSIVGDGDGIVRTVPLVARLGEQPAPSLSLEALRVAQGAASVIVKSSDASGQLGGAGHGVVALKVGRFEVPTTRSGALWLHYTAPGRERITPAWKILTGALPAPEVK